jgi:hypothetical protein
MVEVEETAEPRSWVPWWIDPYSDNPIAFGVLFALLICSIVGGMLLFRFLFITNSGAHPTPPQYLLHLQPLRLWRDLRHLLR